MSWQNGVNCLMTMYQVLGYALRPCQIVLTIPVYRSLLSAVCHHQLALDRGLALLGVTLGP